MIEPRWQGNDNPGHKRRLSLIAAIEEEFSEPLAETIMGLREQGNSWRTVAGALGISRETLRLLRVALRLPLAKNVKVFDPSSLPILSPCARRANLAGYADMRDAVLDLRVRQSKTVAEAAEILGCHPCTVRRYSPNEIKGIWHLSARGREIKSRKAKELRARQMAQGSVTDQHPWRREEILFHDRFMAAQKP